MRAPSGLAIWREPRGWLDSDSARGFISYEKLRGGAALASIKPDTSTKATKDTSAKDAKDAKAGMKVGGTVQLEWNKTGALLLARFESVLSAVHIFAFPTPGAPFAPKLRSVLLHTRPVLGARWNPVRAGSLAVCCGARSIYTWSDEWVGEGPGDEFGLGRVQGPAEEGEEVAECIGVPARECFFTCRLCLWRSNDGIRAGDRQIRDSRFKMGARRERDGFD